MGSTWGNTIKISIFGESHGTGIGVVIDGFPSGVAYDEAFVLREMERRAPGRNKQSTARKEPDRPEIQSGIYNGKTTGTPICAVIRNTNQRSNDYAELAAQPRPGHADYTGMLRYDSCNDPRGGGHFSGRLTAPLVFAGALCKLWLKEQGVTVGSHIQSIAQIQDMPFDDVEVTAEQLDALRNAEYPVNNPRALEAMLAAIEEAREEQDSVGGVIECAAVGLPAGIGSPMLDSVESRLSSILFGVPAVKGVEFGAGFAFAALRGSHANDPFYEENGVVKTETNNNGGGQPQVRGSVRNFTDVRAIRAKALYDNDAAKTIRKSHENPAIQQLYKEFFGEPGSHKAHEILHTSYVKRVINK